MKSTILSLVCIILSMLPMSLFAAALITIDIDKPMPNNLTKLRKAHHSDCEIKSETKTTASGVEVKVYIDPCNLPRLRMFMHCNTHIKKCECYKNWKIGDVTDKYDNPSSFSDKSEYEDWFVYNEGAKECLIRQDKKCGTRSELSPYRCEEKSRCVVLSEEDNLTYKCSSSSERIFVTKWINLVIIFVTIIYNQKL